MVMVRVEGEGKGGVGGKPILPKMRMIFSSAKACACQAGFRIKAIAYRPEL